MRLNALLELSGLFLGGNKLLNPAAQTVDNFQIIG
jgi:hypothetical protein